ncbi:MAG: DUF4340 domain-containing protein [bacterium]|nr:DUF4340 domain-containing protein [bacterium]
MNNRTLLIILGILILILVPLLMKDCRVSRPDEILFTIDTAKVNQFEVVQGNSKTVIKRFPDQWRIIEPVDWPVNNFMISNLLTSIDTIEVEYEVTKDAKLYKQFGVDDSSGAKVTVSLADGKKLSFIVGNLGGTWRHTHFRIPDKKPVYLVKGPIRSQLVKKPDEWRDRRLFNYNQDSLVVMNVQVGKDRYSISKEDTVWKVTPEKGKPFEPNQTRVNGILSGILKMSIADFPSDTIIEKLDWSKIASTFDFEMKDGTKHQLVFTTFQADTNKLYYKVNHLNGVFSVWKATYDMYAIPLKELTAKNKSK